MFDNTGGGGLVEIEKLPYLVVSTTPKIKRGMQWKVIRKDNIVHFLIRRNLLIRICLENIQNKR